MTGVEALQALRDGKKIKRAEWKDGEYLRVYGDRTSICPSFDYHRKRGEDCYYPEDAVILTEDILNDFLEDDWEVVV
jgi:hypothetical protein